MSDPPYDPTSTRPAADVDTVPRALDVVITAVAAKLMAATVWTYAEISRRVLADLVAHLDVDISFLRYNDHRINASILIAEWPPRPVVPDPDPLAVVYFADADAVFAHCAHAKKPAVFHPRSTTEDHRLLLVDAGNGAPAGSTAAVPLVSGDTTTGTLGFVSFGDRRWQDEELNALEAVASLFAQVQARIVAERELRHLAHHDELTGLHNRRWFLAHLAERLRQHEQVTVLFLDLDRLKNINDDLGHAAGDAVLRAAADHLRSALRSDDVLARLGGDEFVASFVSPITDHEIGQLTERIHASLAGPIFIEGARLSIGASIGVVVADHHDPRNPVQILRDADTAMYTAKHTGRGKTHYVACRADAPAPNTLPPHLVAFDPDLPGSRGATHQVLSSAVVHHTVIHQAIGIIRSRTGGTAEQAFAELSTLSESHGTELILVAHRLVEKAVRQAPTTIIPIP